MKNASPGFWDQPVRDEKQSNDLRLFRPCNQCLADSVLEARFDDALGAEVRKKVVNLIFDALL